MNEARGCLNGLIGGTAIWLGLLLIWKWVTS